MPTLTRINDRIFAYEQKLRSWDQFIEKTDSLKLEEEQRSKIAACRNQVKEIIAGYNTLHERLLGENSLAPARLLAAESLFTLEKKDIDYLESNCWQILAGTGGNSLLATTRNQTVVQQEKALRDALDQGDYDTVIASYEQLPLAEGQEPSFSTTFLYGQALLKAQREEEARQVFAGLLERIRKENQAELEFNLMRLGGDLAFGLGDFEHARNAYETIRQRYKELGATDEWAQQQLAVLDSSGDQGQEVAAYADLLRKYLVYNPERDGYRTVMEAEDFLKTYPYSSAASNVDQLVAEMRTKADSWFNGFMAGIDELERNKQFQEALLRIEQVPRDILPLEKQEILNNRADALVTAEAIALETERLLREQTLQENWNKAMAHLEAREYDLAIEGFTALLDSSYAEKARSRIKEAVELAASEDRRRAAELFVRANRTHDLESRKKLLLASRRLLQEILVKYPQSGLINKVKRNLIRIEEEIRAIDPALLQAPFTLDGRPAVDGGSSAQKDRNISPMTDNGQRENMNTQE